MTENTNALPLDWNEFEAEWRAFAACAEGLGLTRSASNAKIPGANFMADERLGTFWLRADAAQADAVRAELDAEGMPLVVELSAVNFLGDRSIGLTYGRVVNGKVDKHVSGPLVRTWAALAVLLGVAVDK